MSKIYNDVSTQGLIKTKLATTDNPYDIDNVLDSLTSLEYGSLYGTFKSVVETASNVKETETKPTADILSTGNNSYTAWDPRLARLDGFVSTSDKGIHPTIVPFASYTAATSFYDMVFTIERKAAEMLREDSTKDAGNNNTKTTDASSVNKSATSGNNIINTSKVMQTNDNTLNELKNDGDLYGVASIVNPYTLTKLCGGLTYAGENKNNIVENHMYDIRDSRRFYGNVISDGVDDVLSVLNPTTTNIITYSNNDKWGRTPYYFLDFVFCKHWNIIPNNHLITLRKYHAPVYDNLQFSNMYETVGDSENSLMPFAPIATVVTYFGDDTGNTLSNLFSFSTGTNWEDKSGDIFKVEGDTGSDPRAQIDQMFENGGGFPIGGSNIMQQILGETNGVTGKIFSFGKFVGLLSPDGYNINNDLAYFEKLSSANMDPTESLYSNRIQGPVNRILSTKARKEGITFDLKISITCNYIARPIGGVNTKAAMLDILSNCLEIGSVDAMFWGGGYRFNIKPHLYPFKNMAFKNRMLDDLYAGKIFGSDGALAHMVDGVKNFGTNNGTSTEFSWSNVTSALANVVGETMGALGELLNSVSNTIFGSNASLGDWLKGAGNAVGDGTSGDKGKNKLDSLLSNVNQMWRSLVVQSSIMPQINGMRALLTGEPVGNWHLTVGNPLNPIMVIGNLICTNMKVECSDVLGPDDFPLELKVTYDLEHAMLRDKSAIQSMFNRGNGRIYQLPDWIRASSDYESTVDKFTGVNNNFKGEFYVPKYMSSSEIMAAGGASGYLTFKMPSALPLAINAHTDSTVIAKFTAPNIDAAISNITAGTNDFFGANSNSRAWIRGIAATRKLMN